MRYVQARWLQYQRDLTYRIYVTDCLQAISENTTHIGGFNGVVDYGKSMPKRWYDFINPAEEQPQEDDRTVTEIAADIFSKMRKKAVNTDVN